MKEHNGIFFFSLGLVLAIMTSNLCPKMSDKYAINRADVDVCYYIIIHQEFHPTGNKYSLFLSKVRGSLNKFLDFFSYGHFYW